MIRASYISSQLKEFLGDDLIQEHPYPVVAPRSVDMIPRIVSIARAENFRILCYGTASSFPADFVLLHDNIIAISTHRLTGLQQLSPFIHRVYAGTPVSSLVVGTNPYGNRTLGGLIASINASQLDETVSALWQKILQIDVVTANGSLRRFNSPSGVHADDPCIANWFLGSRGKLGIITSIDFMVPLPIPHSDTPVESLVPSDDTFSNHILKREEIEALLDPEGLFKW